MTTSITLRTLSALTRPELYALAQSADVSAWFRARIDYRTLGMLSTLRADRPRGVRRIEGDVTDRSITVTMDDGTQWHWRGAGYSSRKINGCYAPLMPKPVADRVPPRAVEQFVTWCTEHEIDTIELLDDWEVLNDTVADWVNGGAFTTVEDYDVVTEWASSMELPASIERGPVSA